MNFFTHKIVNPAGEGKTFDNWVNELLKTAETEQKTASEEAAPGLGQDTSDEPRGQMRGQVINTEGEEAMTNAPEEPTEQGGNARPDTGGTTDQKDNKQTDKGASATPEVKEAHCDKEMGESDKAGDVTEEHSEAKPADDKAEGQQINNDPCYQKGESVTMKKEKEKKASLTHRFEKIATMGRIGKLALFASLSSNDKYPIDYVEAMTGIKVANMTEEEKSWFTDFWLTMYPPEYVKEMVQDR